MTRENADAKARRYLAEGRLVVRHATHDGIAAAVRGDGCTYTTTWTATAGWSCSCPARARCAHLLALGLVTDTSAARKHAGELPPMTSGLPAPLPPPGCCSHHPGRA